MSNQPASKVVPPDLAMSLMEMFLTQEVFQKEVTGMLPHDAPQFFEYHITAMIEELGEVLKADKRWKSHRNTNFNESEKLDELADVFITAINLALWSGFDGADITCAIAKKLKENFKRLEDR